MLLIRSKHSLYIVFCAIAFILLTGFGPVEAEKDRCRKQQYEKADCSGFSGGGAGEAKNVILFIGDGMGAGQVFAGRVYTNGPDEIMTWEEFPNQGLVTTCAIGGITDSAASGTAFATGNKTEPGRVSMGTGPNAPSYQSVLEMVKGRKATGLVTTCNMWGATPAVFAAHVPYRYESSIIARQMVEDTGVDVMLGGGREAFASPDTDTSAIDIAEEKGYTVITDAGGLGAVVPDETKKLLGLFSPHSMTFELERDQDSTEPHLADMVKVALDILDNDERGFFLMVEGARIDSAGHRMSMDRLVLEMEQLDRAIDYVLEWAEDHPDTLIIVTADHETGGVIVKPGKYEKGDEIKVIWSTGFPGFKASHSNQRVPIYAIGPNADAVRSEMDNTEIFCIMKNAFDVDLP